MKTTMVADTDMSLLDCREAIAAVVQMMEQKEGMGVAVSRDDIAVVGKVDGNAVCRQLSAWFVERHPRRDGTGWWLSSTGPRRNIGEWLINSIRPFGR